MTDFVDIGLLALLTITGLAVLRQRNLVAVVMLFGIYSLLCALLYTTLDAVDVAFTEAAVGAGISTVLLLGTLALVGADEHRPSHRPLLPLAVVLITGGVLIYGMSDMPPFGSPDNPAHHHVAPRYVQESGDEIGIPNVVTSVLTSYRAYDTMGEITVIFTAVIAVMLLIATGRHPSRGDNGRGSARSSAGGSGTSRRNSPPGPVVTSKALPEDHVILRVSAKMLIPFILLFALYVQFHGDFGPGGGFQAGVILASGFILYGLIFGSPRVTAVLPESVVHACSALGVIIFVGTGLVAMPLGGAFLNYDVFAPDPHDGQHLGIVSVELGILVTVFGVMVSIFYAFAGRRQEP